MILKEKITLVLKKKLLPVWPIYLYLFIYLSRMAEAGASMIHLSIYLSRVAKAGASIVGVNCLFDPSIYLSVYLSRVAKALSEYKWGQLPV